MTEWTSGLAVRIFAPTPVDSQNKKAMPAPCLEVRPVVLTYFLDFYYSQACQLVTMTDDKAGDGRILTMTEHSLSDLIGRKSSVVWMKKGARYFEAGAKYI